MSFTKKAIAEATERAVFSVWFDKKEKDLAILQNIYTSLAFRGGLGLQNKDMMEGADWKILGEPIRV